MSRTDAVDALYSDMAARHRARFRSIHVRFFVGIYRTANGQAMLTCGDRSFVSSRLRRPTMSSALTSSSSSRRTSASPSPTASPRLLAPRSSARTDPPLSLRVFLVWTGDGQGFFCRCLLRMKNYQLHLLYNKSIEMNQNFKTCYTHDLRARDEACAVRHAGYHVKGTGSMNRFSFSRPVIRCYQVAPWTMIEPMFSA